MVNHHLPEVHSALWDSLRRISPQKTDKIRLRVALEGSLRSSDLGEKGGWLKREKLLKTFSFFVHELLLNWYTMQQQKGLLHFWPLLLDTFLPAEQIDVQSFIHSKKRCCLSQAAFRPDLVRHLNLDSESKYDEKPTSGRSDQSDHKIAAMCYLHHKTRQFFAAPKNARNQRSSCVGWLAGRSSNIRL